MPTAFPPAPPVMSGQNLTVSVFLNNPPYVQRAIEALALNRFLADRILTRGPQAAGGAVLYDQLTAGEFFTDRDVQEIEPTAEFPVVSSGEHVPLVAVVKKWGGSAEISYEAQRRDRRDLLRRELVKLRNTIVRKVDTVAMAALNAAPIVPQSASGDWTTAATDIIGDLETARSTIDQADMGYEADTVVIHPAQALDIRKDADIRTALPRENTAKNLLSAPDLSGLLGFPNWYVSNRQTAGTVHVLDSNNTGGISDELNGVYSRVVDIELRETWRVMAARVAVPYITDPKAVVKITGA